VIAVLGAGVHGRQIAEFYHAQLFDDFLADYPDCRESGIMPFLIGAAFPSARREIAARRPFGHGPWERGQVVFPGVKIGQGVGIGWHTHLLYNAVISHGCQVGSFVTVCSGAVLCGEVTVEDDVFVGANATIIHGGITIGRGAKIGAGAVVLEDVPAGATVVGNPARIMEPAL